MALRRGPYSTRSRALLAGTAVAVVAANILLPGAWTALLFNACFWALLVALLRAEGLGWHDVRYLLPLPFLYYLTFAGRRELAGTYDLVLGADAARYLRDAVDLAVGVRHLGYAVITWPYTAMTRLAGTPVAVGLGTEYLQLQSAVFGGLTVALAARILHELGAGGWRRWGIAYAFGLSFGMWMLAGVVDPQIVSVMLLLLLLLSLLRYLQPGDASGAAGDGGRWAEPCAICLLAATMSIENLYMPLLFAVAWWVRRRPRRGRDLLEPAWFAAALILALGGLLLAADAAAGPGLYAVDVTRFGVPNGIVSHLRVFTALYLEVGLGLMPAEIGRTAFQVFVMAVRAQAGVPVDRYRFAGELLASPANWLYAGLMATLAVAAVGGLRTRRTRVPEFAWVLIAGLLARQLFVSVYDRWESVLFSLPSLALLWLLLGMGICADPRSERGSPWLAAALALLLALLLVSNTAYVLLMPIR